MSGLTHPLPHPYSGGCDWSGAVSDLVGVPIELVQSQPIPKSTRTSYPMTITTATPQVAINDIGTSEDFLAAIELTIKPFNDGDLVEGIVVKVDRDEVL